jgi:CBS domain-containing protein
MSIGEICNRDVVVVEKNATIQEAARLMRDYHVGDLVVLRERDGVKEPAGIVTDRDIVVEVLGEDVGIDAVTVGDIMSERLLTAQEEDNLWETLQRMRIAGVRRLPVVDKHGALQGIVTLDDLIELLAEELAQAAKLVAREQAVERTVRSRG